MKHAPIVCSEVIVSGGVILLAVRWYGLAAVYRNVWKLLAERGTTVDAGTRYRWVQRFAPKIRQRTFGLHRSLRDLTELIWWTASSSGNVVPRCGCWFRAEEHTHGRDFHDRLTHRRAFPDPRCRRRR